MTILWSFKNQDYSWSSFNDELKIPLMSRRLVAFLDKWEGDKTCKFDYLLHFLINQMEFGGKGYGTCRKRKFRVSSL